MNLTNKICLVTGACRGIGKAIAIELAKNSATIVGADLNAELVAEIDAYFKELNLPGRGIVMDVTNQESIDNAATTIKNEFGDVSILVNNAGITRDGLVLRMKQEDWQAVINTNLSSAFTVTQAFLKDMVKARWGRIINITSVVALTGNAGQPNYAAAKAGLIAFSKSLAQEVASRGITVNCIAPGFVDTLMTQKLTPEQREAILNRVPARSIAEPEEIAYVASFLASDRARYITGETININGGMFMA
jgi:3-oxoacyl-[acyl-carrier protein] reductase